MLRVSLRCATVTLVACSLLLAGASSSLAVIVHPQSGKTLSYQPLRRHAAARQFDEVFSNLDYNGGPVMPSNTNYAVYWAPSGAASYPADYQPGLNRYFEDLAHDSGASSNVDSVAAQYNDTASRFASYDSHFGGPLIDTDPYPVSGCKQAATCLTDNQLQVELKSYIKAHGLPHDLTHEYFLLTPPGTESCFTAGGRECSAGSGAPVYCAYHGNIPLADGQIIYSNDPYVSENPLCDDGNHPNGSTSDGALAGGLSHEHNESTTDPLPNSAWTDFASGFASGYEIGDKCGESNGTPLGTAANGASYNQLINGDTYWYQQEWSDQGSKCRQRLTFSGAEPTATFTGTPVAGNEVSFDAAGSTAPNGVSAYDWQFNDGPGQTFPTETTSPTVSHTFRAAGVYVVALTVFAKNGTAIGTSRTLVVGEAPPPTVTKVTPVKGAAGGGTSVTISGTNFTGTTAVDFGATSATSFTVKSSKTILATSPPSAAGPVDVTVTSPAGTSAVSLPDRFTFGPPTITGLSPNGGPTAGGSTVTVTGTGFALGSTATTFKIATTYITSVQCTSITSCTIVLPAHKAGTVELRATVSKLTSPKNPPADQFSYS